MTKDGRDEPEWGSPPIPEVLGPLLRQRHEPSSDMELEVQLLDEPRGLRLNARRGSRTTELAVMYRRGAKNRDPWLLTVDALDALFGMWCESGFEHRALPSGEDVRFHDAMFRVDVVHRVPELDRLADQILGSTDENPP